MFEICDNPAIGVNCLELSTIRPTVTPEFEPGSTVRTDTTIVTIEELMGPSQIDETERAYAAILAAKTPAERISMVAEAHRMARLLAAAGVRYLHPDWTEAQVQAEVARRMSHGTDLNSCE
jgi:hypothetical protein